MNSAALFTLSALAIVLVALSFVVPPTKWKEYFSTKDGKGVLKGIVMALLFGAVIVASTKAFSDEQPWYLPDPGRNLLPEASVFLGMDHTKNVSPMCIKGGLDDKWTSNLGLRLGLFESADGKFSIASKYTHHPCAYGVDDSSYDALGVELEYKIWER